jgi:glycosyltransferase involved in cell wall biosynthesis
MPRALLEAMARGMPCIASRVGGVPELLAPEDIVTPGDAGELAAKIQQTLADRKRASEMAARNFETSKRYSEWVLKPVREQTYRMLAEDYARAAHR